MYTQQRSTRSKEQKPSPTTKATTKSQEKTPTSKQIGIEQSEGKKVTLINLK